MAVQTVSSTSATPPASTRPAEAGRRSGAVDEDVARALLREMQRHYDALTALVVAFQRQFVDQRRPTKRRRKTRNADGVVKMAGADSRADGMYAAVPGVVENLFQTALDSARLDGALLMARTAAHLISNDLTATVGLIGIVQNRLRRGESVDLQILDDAVVSARRAAKHLRDLQRVARLEVQRDGGDAPEVLDLVLSRDLSRSAHPPAHGRPRAVPPARSGGAIPRRA